MSKTSIELLSPARNLECGIAAIDHGADAVYIGAPRFGARAAAGNTVDDIARLCQYAHPFGVRIYATLNTILYDSELDEAEQLVWELYRAGVDALIVQDMALMEMHLPPIALHASTQMDNRTPEQVAWLASLGYEQVVLARELSTSEIRRIHEAAPAVQLEAFIHGALCVSLSGRCYASQSCFGRSANRGECAQFCRLPFTLEDSEGHVLSAGKHLLSLRDMNRSQHLEEMMDAGVSSFKIEGRLKDVSYVKNITAYYRRQIDAILRRRPEYVRSSRGIHRFSFTPDPERSFSRGFTDYFLHGRTPHMSSPDTPKSCGPVVGTVKEVRRDCLIVSGTTSFSNGDGLCFLDRQGRLHGFRINRAEGNHLFPAQMPAVERGTTLRRNYDQQWETRMARPTAERRIPLRWTLTDTDQGFTLTATPEGGVPVSLDFPLEHQQARTDQTPSITETLSRMGDTVFETTDVDIRLATPWFIPRSTLAEWRRQVTARIGACSTARRSVLHPTTERAPSGGGVYSAAPNVSNRLARRFYETHGVDVSEPALEVLPAGEAERTGAPLMQCRYCLRYEMGLCRRQLPPHETSRRSPSGHNAAPLYLVSQDGRRFRLDFDCAHCQMLLRHA